MSSERETPVLAAAAYKNNAELISTVARLGYIGESVLDLTYGLGKFWDQYHPTELVTNDINPGLPCQHHWDWTCGPIDWWVDRFDTTVFDGPYRLNGTPDLGEFDTRYGVATYETWKHRMSMLRAGLSTAVASTRPKGTILVKCQDQVVSGHKVWQTRELADWAETRCGARLIDLFHMTRFPRAQPPGRRQVHSRSNYSSLLVLRRNK